MPKIKNHLEMNITPSDQENVRQNIQKYSNKIAKTLENQKPTTQPTRDVEWYKEYCNLASNMLLEKHHREHTNHECQLRKDNTKSPQRSPEHMIERISKMREKHNRQLQRR